MLLRGALILLLLVCTVCPGESKNGVYLRCLQRCLFAKCVRENPGCINYCRWSCLKHLFRRNSVWEDDRYSSNSILFGAK